MVRKFQLAHFLIVNNKSFNFYKDLVHFTKEFYNVDVGSGYLQNVSAKEMVLYLSKSIVEENIAIPLNERKRLYFSMLFDGSSNAKTMDEKEVYVIKTCENGKPRYDVLSLEQPEDANAARLKFSLEDANEKAKFSFNRCERETGLGSDGTNTNKRLYELEKEDVGDHLCLILCLNHKLELAVHKAFQQSSLNEDAEKQLVLTYYSSKKANLKWHLFKRHTITVGESYRRYKRPSGTRWVAHQSDALDSFLSNLACLLGYLHNQISDPYNATMTKEGPRLGGVLSDCSDFSDFSKLSKLMS